MGREWSVCVWVGGRILGRERQIKMQQQQDVDK